MADDSRKEPSTPITLTANCTNISWCLGKHTSSGRGDDGQACSVVHMVQCAQFVFHGVAAPVLFAAYPNRLLWAMLPENAISAQAL